MLYRQNNKAHQEMFYAEVRKVYDAPASFKTRLRVANVEKRFTVQTALQALYKSAIFDLVILM